MDAVSGEEMARLWLDEERLLATAADPRREQRARLLGVFPAAVVDVVLAGFAFSDVERLAELCLERIEHAP